MFDIGKLLGGDESGMGGLGGMFGGSIMNMVTKQLSNPKTQAMIEGKSLDLFDFVAARLNCTRNEVSFVTKVEKVPVEDENGTKLLETNEAGVAVQKLQDKTIIYLCKNGKAEEKITITQLLALMQPG